MSHTVILWIGCINGSCMLFGSDSVKAHEALDIANVIYSIVTYCPMNVITQLPSDIVNDFFSYLSRVTCEFCRAAADENVCWYKMYILSILMYFSFKLHFCIQGVPHE